MVLAASAAPASIDMRIPTLLFLTLLLASACSLAMPLDMQLPQVQHFLDSLQDSGVSPDDAKRWLSSVDIKPQILKVMDQPATSRPWHEFAPNFLNPKRIAQGVEFWKQQQKTLLAAEQSYGVPPEIVVGILGAETSFGRLTGNWRAIDALSTLAFYYPRRSDYFTDELRHLLLLAHEENLSPLEIKSSFAGALGWPQFMPSNYRLYSVDFDGDGHRNVWSDPADVIGSVAHYLQQKGNWQPGQPIAVRADISHADAETLASLLNDRFNLHYTVAELKTMGVVAQTAAPDDARAILFKLDNIDGPEYWLGFANFYAITRYNKSVNYAMVVWQLGQDIAAAAAKP